MRRVFLVAALTVLALPASALAAARYASPGGGSAVGCPQATPCSLAIAITGAAANDEVVVTPGVYSVGSTIEAKVPLSIHGQAGQPRPLVVGAPNVTPLVSGQPLTLSWLAADSTEGPLGTIEATADGDVFNQLELSALGFGAVALRPGNNFTVADSLLVAEGTSSAALFMQGMAANTAASMRNDTAISRGSGSVAVDLAITAPFTAETLTATNVIADGPVDAEGGEEAIGSFGTIVFEHSNLDTKGAGVVTIESQTAPPQFVNAAVGDYREAPGSPTIDAGLNATANGGADLAGNPRALPGLLACGTPPPAITDIGAYEFVPTAPTCAPPPARMKKPKLLQTTLAKARIHGRTATFRFTGSGGSPGAALGFGCQLDRRPWRTCSSPTSYKRLNFGRHIFRARATRGGAVDATPAVKHFKIKRPHRHHGNRAGASP